MSDPSDEKPLVSLEHVVLRLGGHAVLDGIDLQVRSRERLVVPGQSGGGKSTLLRLMMGIPTPAEGRVRFRDQEVGFLGRRALKTANLAQMTDTLKRQPWRLLWPSTKKYGDAAAPLQDTDTDALKPGPTPPPVAASGRARRQAANH